jgi:hypothetical protein
MCGEGVSASHCDYDAKVLHLCIVGGVDNKGLGVWIEKHSPRK